MENSKKLILRENIRMSFQWMLNGGKWNENAIPIGENLRQLLETMLFLKPVTVKLPKFPQGSIELSSNHIYDLEHK